MRITAPVGTDGGTDAGSGGAKSNGKGGCTQLHASRLAGLFAALLRKRNGG